MSDESIRKLEDKLAQARPIVNRLYNRRVRLPGCALIGAAIIAASTGIYAAVNHYLRTARDLESANSRIVELEKMPDKREVLDLRQKADQLEQKVAEYAKETKNAYDEATKFASELLEEKTANEQLKKDLEQKNSLYSTLQEEFNKLKETYQSLEQERNKLVEQGRTSDARYSQLEKEMNEVKDKYQAAEHDIKRLTEENEKLKDDAAKAEEPKKITEENPKPGRVDTFGQDEEHSKPDSKKDSSSEEKFAEAIRNAEDTIKSYRGEKPAPESPQPKTPSESPPEKPAPSDGPGLKERVDTPPSRRTESDFFPKPGKHFFSHTIPQAYVIIGGSASEDIGFGSFAAFIDTIPNKPSEPLADHLRVGFGFDYDRGAVKQKGDDATFWKHSLRMSPSGILFNNDSLYLDLGIYAGWNLFDSHDLQGSEPKQIDTFVLGSRARMAIPYLGFEAHASASSNFNSGSWSNNPPDSEDYKFNYFDGGIKQYVGARTSLGLDGFVQYDIFRDLNRTRYRRATFFLETMGDNKAKDMLGYWLLLSVKDDDSKKLRAEIRSRILINPVGRFFVGAEGWYDDPHRGGSGWGVSAFIGLGISTVKDKPDLRIPLIYEK